MPEIDVSRHEQQCLSGREKHFVSFYVQCQLQPARVGREVSVLVFQELVGVFPPSLGVSGLQRGRGGASPSCVF